MNPKSFRGLTFVVAGSVPITLAFESLARKFLFPPEFEELRRLLADPATTTAWVALLATPPAAIAGHFALRWAVPRALADADRSGGMLDRRRALLDRMMLTSSIPQVPALVATIAAMLGASLSPVLASVILSSAAVLLQQIALERHPDLRKP